jgi:hypothetical protein
MFGVCVKLSRNVISSVAIAVLGLGALSLTGCGANQAGAAALLGDQRISESELNAQVQGLLAAQGLPAQDSSAEIITVTLDRLITTNLVNQLAEREGVAIDQGEVDAIRLQYLAQAGGQAELENLLLQQGVLPNQIDSVITLNLQVTKLGQELAPDQEPDIQGQAVFVAVSELSRELDTEVAPRFGTWDAENLTIGPVTNSVSEPLSVDLGQG